jgi:hypothetical protein
LYPGAAEFSLGGIVGERCSREEEEGEEEGVLHVVVFFTGGKGRDFSREPGMAWCGLQG